MQIRKIEKKDNEVLQETLKVCLKEVGLNKASIDALGLDDLYEQYLSSDGNYWVVEDLGDILGGCGVGPLDGHNGICILENMYLLPEARNQEVAIKLLEVTQNFAKVQYHSCYVESFQEEQPKINFFVRQGFEMLPNRLTDTIYGQLGFIKKLKNDA